MELWAPAREDDMNVLERLDEIGSGSFSMDQLTHAENTIDLAKEIRDEVRPIVEELLDAAKVALEWVLTGEYRQAVHDKLYAAIQRAETTERQQ
jgi:hypothetical protein